MRRWVILMAKSLAVAAGLSAVVLGGLALTTLRIDCEGRGAAECRFEQATAAHIAQRQALAALSFWLVATGGWLLLRRER
jgi:hypothetical protein